jgi:hypothetical protein
VGGRYEEMLGRFCNYLKGWRGFILMRALKIQNAGRESGVEMRVLLLLLTENTFLFYCQKNEYKAAAFAFEVALRRQIIQRRFSQPQSVKNYLLSSICLTID